MAHLCPVKAHLYPDMARLGLYACVAPFYLCGKTRLTGMAMQYGKVCQYPSFWYGKTSTHYEV